MKVLRKTLTNINGLILNIREIDNFKILEIYLCIDVVIVYIISNQYHKKIFEHEI